MKSHIQLPKSILKNFSHKDGRKGRVVPYIDMVTNSIKIEKIKELGTKEGFYSEAAEDYLCKMVEGPMGPIMKKLKIFGNYGTSLQLTPEEQLHIRKYINYFIYRSNYFIEMVNEESVFAKILGPMNREFLFGLAEETENADVFKDFGVNIFVNKSNIEFVVPQHGFYYYYKGGKSENPYVIFPFSPRVAVVLVTPNEFKKYVKNGHLYYLNIDDERTILNLNRFAFSQEKQTGNNFIAASRTDELELLMK